MKTMYRKMNALLLVLCILLGMLPTALVPKAEAAEVSDVIHIDFKQIAAKAAEQRWWEDIPTVTTTDGHEAKRVGGAMIGTEMTEEARSAYAALRDWLWENEGWTINERQSYFDYATGGNRLYLSADENIDWGISHNTYYRDYCVAFDVKVPSAGRYALSALVSKISSSSKDIPNDGWDHTHPGTLDVLVNGELVYDEYDFSGTGLAETDFGTVILKEGTNTIVFNSSLNYVGNANPTPCWHFNMRSMTLTSKEKESVREETKESVVLKGVYLPKDEEIVPETHSAVSCDESIVLAQITSDGLLEIFGITPGETMVTILKDDEQAAQIKVKVTDVDEALMDPITLDFKEFAKQAQMQPFWDDLHTAADENTKYIGRIMNYDTIPETEQAAYDQLVDWGMETFGWTIDEGASGFKSWWKRLYFNGQDNVPWGMCMYTYYHGADSPAWSKLVFTVTAPADGWYQVDLNGFKEENWPGYNSTINYAGPGGDRIAVYVNGEEIYYDYSLVGEDYSFSENMGAAYLHAGKNTVAIDSVLSYNELGVGGRSNVPLMSMTFEPLRGVELQEHLSDIIELNETYLPFDADVHGLRVETLDETIANATINNSGVVTVYGTHRGQTKVLIKRNDEVIAIIPVTVTPFEGTLDELQGSAVEIDFMYFADRAADQTWWEADGDTMTVSSDDMGVGQWLREHTYWDLTDGQLNIHAGNEKYGACFTGEVTLQADIPASGMYNVTAEYLGGGGTLAVSINDEAIHEEIDTGKSSAVHKTSLGAAALKKGGNTIVLSATEDVYLRAIYLTPLGAVQVEAGHEQYIDLQGTYLAYDEDASVYKADIAHGTIASVSVDSDGELLVKGKAAGETVLTVHGEKTFQIPIKVVEAGELMRVIYTADDFKAETLQVGEIANGSLTGITTQQTRLTEKYVYRFGSVYYTTSDNSVAQIDQKTGDISCLAEGTVIITAYVLMDGKTLKDSVKIIVTDDTDLAAVEVSAPVDFVGVSGELQLRVSGVKQSGAAADMSKFPVSWSVNDETVAEISSDGRLKGLAEGTVEVTATVGVMRLPVTDTLEIKVVNDAELSGGTITLQFDEGRMLDIFEWTLERDGLQLVVEETAHGGEGMFMDAMGIRHAAPAGEGVSLDFVVKKSGWYRTAMQGKQLTGVGGICYCYVDNSYVGYMDGGAANSNEGAGGTMNTVWLEAGVHNVRVIAQQDCQVMIGRIYFYPTKDPNPVSAQVQVEPVLVEGQKADVDVVFTDASGYEVQVLRTENAAEFDNFCCVESTSATVVSVNNTQVTANRAGTANLVLSGNVYGEFVSLEVPVTVTRGKIFKAELTAEETTFKPDAESQQLTLNLYDVNGAVLTALPAGTTIRYESSHPAVVAVDENGAVSFRGEEGSAMITAVVEEQGREVRTSIWITATNGKTEPTLYTYAEREAAQENALKYDWAWEKKETAVQKADLYVEKLDQIYHMWIPETFPRATQVGFKTDPNYRYCRYCGEDLVTNYHSYPYIVDPIENPWKIKCPACLRSFPSNDFGAYYNSGLGTDGRFHEELANKSLLTNDLYPEMGEGWGVDNGWGYTAEDGSVHTYIAYYLACVFEGLYQKHSMTTIMNALRDAYLCTGDEKYGSAGAILTDRIADIYPEYDVYDYDWYSYCFMEAYSGRGKFIGLTWDAILAKDLSRYVDTFWPAADNPDVVEYLRGKASFKGMEPEEITPEYIRKNAEDGILMEIYEAAQCGWIQGNFGMSEAAVAYAAHTLNKLPESQEMVDWVFRSEVFSGSGRDYQVSGGDVMRTMIDAVSRDGLGNEGSTTYNYLLVGNSLDVADALDGFDLVEGYDLWKNQKFVNLFTGAMRMVTLGHLTPQIHEGGNPQQTNFTPNITEMLTAFTKTGDREIARAIYAANGNTTDGLHGDIFTKDPESGIRSAISEIVSTDGTWDLSDSDMLSGYGIAMLREGPRDYLGVDNAHEFSTYWMGFGYSDISHAQLETLHMDVEAFGLSLSSSMGYPSVVLATDAERMQWVRNTISHNTVVVDDKGQSPTDEAGFPLHFEDAGYAKVMDVQDNKAYEETDVYRRTVIAVDNGDGVHYAVDFFRVLGGSEHVYSFHGATDIDAAVTGLDLAHQAMGTYAGPEVPYGAVWDHGLNFTDGYSWLDDVYRDDAPDTTFSVDWAVKDFHNRLSTTNAIHLKLTMVSEEPMTEVALANGYVPRRIENRNFDHFEYMLARRSGEEGLDTLFTAVIEPYQYTSYIASAELVDMTLVSGNENAGDRAAAMKVTLTSGRVDYVLYATNSGCTYRVDDRFDFCGFAGVVSYTDGHVTYAWGNEASQVADVIEGVQPAITGSIVDFTKGITMDGYTMTVTVDDPVSADDLTDRYIYVETDGIENGVYRIYGAQINGNTAVLDLKHQTLVREYADRLDFSKGYRYNIAEGAEYTIPLSATFDMASLVNYTADQVVKAGYRMDLQVGIAESGATYEAEGLAKGMKFDAATGKITWTPSKTQVGRYPIAVRAMTEDSDVIATMEFVIYVVSYTGASYDASVCKHAKAITYTVDGVDETVCPACGTITKSEPEEEPIETIAIAGTNMNLGNELALNFMFPKSLDASKSYTAIITQTSNGKTVKTTEVASSDWASFNNTLYKVTASVRAMEMADELSIQIVDEDGNVYNNAYATSVRAYGMKALSAASSTSEMKTLVVDMLNYGAEAQTKFSYNTADLANNLLTDAHKALATGDVACTNNQVKGKNYIGTNLALEDKIELNLFFKDVTTDMYAEVSYTDFGGNVVSYTVDGSEFILYSGTIYKVPVSKIVLADAFSPVTVTVYNADGTIHGTVTDSVESYIARAAENALNDAIMKFATAARNYLT